MTGAAGLRTGFALAALACLAGAGACLWLRPETLPLAAPTFAALAAIAFAALAVQSRRRARFAAEIGALRQRLENGAAPGPGAPPPPIHALEQLVLARLAAAATALAAAQAEQARLQALSREDGESRDAEARAARTAMDALTEALKAVAGGDLTLRLGGTLPPESAAAGQKFDQAVTLVTKAMLAFATSLGAIRAQSRGIWGGARKLARRGEARANAMGAAARTLQSAAQAVQGEAAQAAAARAALGDIVPTLAASVSGARAGGAALEGFVGAAGRIADITALIDDVSFQTNLLALNAGVEAARAGEAGRGIAVVAQELRALSARSTQAAKDLSALLNTALREARASSGGVLQAAQALEALAPRAEAAERFAVAASEQGARRAGEFAALARELEALVADAAQDQTLIGEANEAGAALEALLGKLAGLVAHFRFEHDDFGFDAAMPEAPDEADDPPPVRQTARLAARRPTLALADRRRAGL